MHAQVDPDLPGIPRPPLSHGRGKRCMRFAIHLLSNSSTRLSTPCYMRECEFILNYTLITLRRKLCQNFLLRIMQAWLVASYILRVQFCHVVPVSHTLAAQFWFIVPPEPSISSCCWSNSIRSILIDKKKDP